MNISKKNIFHLIFLIFINNISICKAQTRIDYRWLNESLGRVSVSAGIFFDPLLMNEILVQSDNFAVNYCPKNIGLGETNWCMIKLFKSSGVDKMMTDFMKNIVQNRSIYTNNNINIKNSKYDINYWPPLGGEPSLVAVIEVPESLVSKQVSLQGAAGPIVLGKGARYLIVRPGLNTIIFGTGAAAIHQTVAVQARARLALSGTADQIPVRLGRIIPLDLAHCAQRPPPPPVSDKLSHPLYWRASNLRKRESDDVRLKNLAPFATQAGLEVSVAIDGNGVCTERCINGLGIAFVRSIATWRENCSACDSNMFSVIKIGPNTWLDVRVIDLIGQMGEGKLSATAMNLRPSGVISYDQVDDNAELIANVCTTSSLPTPWFAPLKAALCTRGSMGIGFLRPELALRGNQTACGEAKDFIACGVPGGKVEVALSGSRFSIPLADGSYTEIGSSDGQPIDLTSVLFHEVGHWLGVPHSETAGKEAVLDVMSETYDPRRTCISSASVIMLNNATDRRWPYSTKSFTGLRRRMRSR
ncbi:MAG: hypothetical protein IPN84_07990 [Sphingomonadales bacterium]|nr:hypothetical protein [Sphingomonadales bacterium]